LDAALINLFLEKLFQSALQGIINMSILARILRLNALALFAGFASTACAETPLCSQPAAVSTVQRLLADRLFPTQFWPGNSESQRQQAFQISDVASDVVRPTNSDCSASILLTSDALAEIVRRTGDADRQSPPNEGILTVRRLALPLIKLSVDQTERRRYRVQRLDAGGVYVTLFDKQ
jgi:hypothetical protein